jgi:hypothetical protein
MVKGGGGGKGVIASCDGASDHHGVVMVRCGGVIITSCGNGDIELLGGGEGG